MAKSNNKQEPAPGKLRIIPLGGLGEIGKNMTVFEYGEDLIVVDVGSIFPREDMPGVDLVIPDTTYLEKNAARRLISINGAPAIIAHAPTSSST